jgi:putative transposase
MVIRLVALLSRQLFRLVLLSCRTSRSKDIELLVLRQEVAILRRQVNRPKVKPEERMVPQCCNDSGRCGNGLHRW